MLKVKLWQEEIKNYLVYGMPNHAIILSRWSCTSIYKDTIPDFLMYAHHTHGPAVAANTSTKFKLI